MISNDLQDQAALYALGLLDAEENALFEAAMSGNAELRAMVREMREASADLARCVPFSRPPAELKRRLWREIALEQQNGASRSGTSTRFNWMPWAIAALFMVCCGVLLFDRARLQRELADERGADPFGQTTLVSLASSTGDYPETKAIVAWQPDRQSGVITINHLPPPGKGRDYQLWAVDANHKDPINAGLIHIESNGVTRVHFKPDQKAAQVTAFAISLEREGGVPQRKGPIVLIGNA
jgi:anti-sigma-K factor RskA